MKKLSLLTIFFAVCCAAYSAPVPDAQAAAYLKKLAAKIKPETFPRSGRTAIFSRAQLKYGLERNDYLHRWVDRPLLQNSSFPEMPDYIHPQTWQVMHRIIKDYTIDGFAFFPHTKRRDELFEKAATPGASDLIIIPEFTVGQSEQSIYTVAEAALKSKQVYRINGKIVITSYPGSRDGKFWADVRTKLKAKFGDKFLLVPYHSIDYRLMRKPTLTLADIKSIEANIREFLRDTDGYYHNSPPLERRRYDERFDRDVIIPIVKSILSEDEFKDKLFAWGTKVGHENYYHKGSYTFDSAGTMLLRGTVGSAVASGADIINCVEWDEENENTHFRPTLYNSYSTMRIMRYFSALAKKNQLKPLESDDTFIPNLILSYRKILVAGQTLELELLYVPDGSEKSSTPATLLLRTADGRVIKKYDHTFYGRKLAEKRFNLPVAELLKHHIIIPEIVCGGRTFNGFTPIELRANWNFDYKWVKQPLRDLISAKTSIALSNQRKDGLYEITCHINSDTPLHSVELLDSGDQIFSYDENLLHLNESNDTVVLQLLINTIRKTPYKGAVRFQNVSSIDGIISYGGSISHLDRSEKTWVFPGIHINPSSHNGAILNVAIPRADAEKAVIEYHIENKFSGSVKVTDILKKRIYSITDGKITTMIFRHTDIPMCQPRAIGKKQLSFKKLVRPALPQSVCYLEIVDVNGKTFRSEPVTVYRPSGKNVKFSAIDYEADKRITVTADKNMLTVHKYEISPEHGSTVVTTGGDRLTGIFSESAAYPNNLLAFGEAHYGNPVYNHCEKTAKTGQTCAPEIIKAADGSYAWKFDGNDAICLPVATIYPFSGFSLKMDITPEKIGSNQILLTSGNAGFEMYIKKDRVALMFYRGNSSGRNQLNIVSPVKLSAGKKHSITVNFDQKNLSLNVDGKITSAPCTSFQYFPSPVSIGANSKGNGFYGKISRLELSPL